MPPILRQISERRIALGLLLLLTCLTAAFYRDFAHLGIPFPGGQVFVTELAILLIGALITLESMRRGRVELQFGVGSVIVSAYLAWGLVCLIRGRVDGVVSLRDSATNYYSLFFLAVPLLAKSHRDLVRLIKAVCAGTAIAAVVVVVRILAGEGSSTSTGALRYHSYLGVGGSLCAFWMLGTPARDGTGQTPCRGRAAGQFS